MPLDQFTGPKQVNIWELPASEEFGGVLVTVKSAGLPVNGLRYALGAPSHLWRFDRPEVHHLFLTTGTLITVPVGIYDLTCEGVFESRIPALNRSGLEVKRGEIQEIVVDSPISWSRCRFAFKRAGSSQSLVGGMLHLMNASTGTNATKLISHFDPPFDMWLPEGTLGVRAEAHGPDPAMVWRYENAAEAIGGGTLGSPQLIEREMVLAKR